MEQVELVKKIDTKNNQPFLRKHPRYKVFFNLKEHMVVQQNIINTLLKRHSCSIEDLACMLHLDAKKLSRVWQGVDKLTEKKSYALVCLFYISCN